MHSKQGSGRETVLALFDAYEAICAKLADLNFGAMSLPELLELQSRLEHQTRAIPAVDYALIAEMQTRTTPQEIGAKSWADVLATRMRISLGAAKHRIADAAALTPRTTLTGETLPPQLPATAAAQAEGRINAEHLAVIRDFFAHPPIPLDALTTARVDKALARIASGNSPETLRRCAKRISFHLNQDGSAPTDEKRARRRGIKIGPQDDDGMSRVEGWLDPEGAATMGAVLTKLGAPGMCNPAAAHPCTSGTPSQEAIAGDQRSATQRNHDALVAMGRMVLASKKLGRHNGLPVSIIATATLQDLLTEAGVAHTSSGTQLPISDVIRMAAHANHYLAIFDKHTNVPLYLARTKRIASVGQRIVLTARDRGCTRPACTQPPDRCQAHHGEKDFAQGGLTDITALTLACQGDNLSVGPNKWTTRVNDNGQIEWVPPPLLDTGQDRLNHYWKTEDLVQPPDEDDGEDDGDGPLLE
jgi:hypothetical protein